MEQDYDRIADHFGQTRYENWPEFDLIQQMARPTDTLLDVGCGNGRLAEINQKIKLQYTGVDLSSELIGLAQQRFPDVAFVHGSMLELPFEDNTFSFVVAIASLQHIPSEELRLQALQEMARVAAPGARLFMTNWNLYQDVLPDYFAAAQQEFGDEWDKGDALVPWKNPQGELLTNRYYHGFKEEEMFALASEAGWNVQEQYYMARAERTDNKTGFNLITVATL